MKQLLFMGALLAAAPLLCQSPLRPDPVIAGGVFEWFELGESRADVAKRFGPATAIADFGSGYQSWQYQIDNSDHDSFSHQLVFRKSTGELVSVTRNYDPERPVDGYFPKQETRVESYPSSSRPEFTLRIRKLTGERLLLAPGGPGQPAGQIFIIRRDELRVFYPWLAERLR